MDLQQWTKEERAIVLFIYKNKYDIVMNIRSIELAKTCTLNAYQSLDNLFCSLKV